MQVADLIHRLRIRSYEARDGGKLPLAEDLRLAIATLEQLDRDLRFAGHRHDQDSTTAPAAQKGA